MKTLSYFKRVKGCLYLQKVYHGHLISEQVVKLVLRTLLFNLFLDMVMEYKMKKIGMVEKKALHQKIIQGMKKAQNKIKKEKDRKKEIEEEKTKSMFYF